MYNRDKYGYVIVKIDKDDYEKEYLVEDLFRWTRHLYESEELVFKGLCPVKEIKNIKYMVYTSYMGDGYDITVDGLKLDEYLSKVG